MNVYTVHITRAYRFKQCGACANHKYSAEDRIGDEKGNVKSDCVAAQTVHTDSQTGLYSQCGQCGQLTERSHITIVTCGIRVW